MSDAENVVVKIPLPPRSLLIMYGASRYFFVFLVYFLSISSFSISLPCSFFYVSLSDLFSLFFQPSQVWHYFGSKWIRIWLVWSFWRYILSRRATLSYRTLLSIYLLSLFLSLTHSQFQIWVGTLCTKRRYQLAKSNHCLQRIYSALPTQRRAARYWVSQK